MRVKFLFCLLVKLNFLSINSTVFIAGKNIKKSITIEKVNVKKILVIRNLKIKLA